MKSCKNIPGEPSLLHAEPTRPSQPVTTAEVLQLSDHLGGILWIHSSRSPSFPCWGPQRWVQPRRWGLMGAEQRGRIPSLSLPQAMLLWEQPRTHHRPAPCAASAHGRLGSHLPPPHSPSSFPAGLEQEPSSSSRGPLPPGSGAAAVASVANVARTVTQRVLPHGPAAAGTRSVGSSGNTGGHMAARGTRTPPPPLPFLPLPSPSLPAAPHSPSGREGGNAGGAGRDGSNRIGWDGIGLIPSLPQDVPVGAGGGPAALGVTGGDASGRPVGNTALFQCYSCGCSNSVSTKVIRSIKFCFIHNSVWALSARSFPGPKSCSRVPLRLPQRNRQNPCGGHENFHKYF